MRILARRRSTRCATWACRELPPHARCSPLPPLPGNACWFTARGALIPLPPFLPRQQIPRARLREALCACIHRRSRVRSSAWRCTQAARVLPAIAIGELEQGSLTPETTGFEDRRCLDTRRCETRWLFRPRAGAWRAPRGVHHIWRPQSERAPGLSHKSTGAGAGGTPGCAEGRASGIRDQRSTHKQHPRRGSYEPDSDFNGRLDKESLVARRSGAENYSLDGSAVLIAPRALATSGRRAGVRAKRAARGVAGRQLWTPPPLEFDLGAVVDLK